MSSPKDPRTKRDRDNRKTAGGKRRAALSAHLILALAAALIVRFWAAVAAGIAAGNTPASQLDTLAGGGSASASHLSWYALFLGWVYSIAGDFNHIAVFIVQGIVGTLAVYLVYLVASKLENERAAAIAAWMSALYPGFILQGASVNTDAFAVLFICGLMALAASGARDRYTHAATGLLLGLGMTITPPYLLSVPGIALTNRKTGAILTIGLGIFAAFIGCRVLTGEAHPARRYTEIFRGIAHEDMTPYTWLDMAYDNLTLLYKSHPGSPVTTDAAGAGKTVPSFYARKYSYLAVLLLGAIGLCRYLRRKDTAAVLPVLAFVLLLITTGPHQNAAFRALLEPLLVLYAAVTFSRIAGVRARQTNGMTP